MYELFDVILVLCHALLAFGLTHSVEIGGSLTTNGFDSSVALIAVGMTQQGRSDSGYWSLKPRGFLFGEQQQSIHTGTCETA